MRFLLAAVLLPFPLVAESVAEGKSPCSSTDVECFFFFNECQPIPLVIEPLTNDEAEIGLTEERIQTIAESRLRAARLYQEGGLDVFLWADHYLYVNVLVVGNAFSFDVGYFKKLHDGKLGMSNFAQTWQTGATGTHSRDAGHIMQNLSEKMDKFIVEYLRVNEGACNGGTN